MSTKPFKFKQFAIEQEQCTMKVGTDGVLLGAWVNINEAQTILDIGTGTGVIAIMAAQRNASAMVSAVEIEEASFLEAKSNMEKSPFKDRLGVEHCSIQDFAKATFDEFDVIVCNPPFFSGGTLSDNLDRNAVRHTIKMPTGDLLNCSRRLLSKQGRLAVVLPYIEGLRFKEQATQYGFYCTKQTNVRSKKDKPVERLLLQFEKQDHDFVEDELIIQLEKRNDYTKDYIALTKDFYLNM